MSKLIKVSDAVGEALAKRADEDNLSMAGEVAKLLSVASPVDTSYFDKKFDELKSLIEDTTVDRLDGGVNKWRGPKICSNLCWDGCMQDVYFDFPETDPIWLPGVYQGWAESNMMDEAKFLIKDDVIWVEFFGTQTPALRITPALRSYLKEKGFEV